MQLGFEKSREEGRVTEQLHITSHRHAAYSHIAKHTERTLIKS